MNKDSTKIAANALLKKGLEEFEEQPYTACANAVVDIKKALQMGADINIKDKDGNTLLHIVAGSKKVKTYNAYIHMTLETHDKFREEYSLDLANIISKYKPNPFVKNNQGFTPSFVAAMNNQTKESQMLLSYESSCNAHANSEAFKAMGDIIQGQQYKKVEQVVQMGGDAGIIERYHATDHQPQKVVSAKATLNAISLALKGKNWQNDRQ